ncbi:vomeronasal type-2 receptor 26-like [Discoglossus pictus]
MRKRPYLDFYKMFLSFLFAIEEINKDPNILPNFTLGYHIYDSCGHTKKAVKSVLQILSGQRMAVPNYLYTGHGKLAGVIGDWSSDTTLSIAQVLSVYGYTQISYGETDPALSDRTLYPSLFRMLQDNRVHYHAILKLLEYFRWTWVGIIASHEESAEKGTQELIKQTSNRGICIEYIITINYQRKDFAPSELQKYSSMIQRSLSSVIVLCGTFAISLLYALNGISEELSDKTLILPPSWSFNKEVISLSTGIFQNSLILEFPTVIIPGMETFLQHISPAKFQRDPLLADFLVLFYQCSPTISTKMLYYHNLYKGSLQNCTGNEAIPFKSVSTLYQVYNAVHAMAHGLHNLHQFIAHHSHENNKQHSDYKNQIQMGWRRSKKLGDHLVNSHFVKKRKSSISLPSGTHGCGHCKFCGYMMTKNFQLQDRLGKSIQLKGFYNCGTTAVIYCPECPCHLKYIGKTMRELRKILGEHLCNFKNAIKDLEKNKIITSVIPKSQCSTSCLPGYRKAEIEGKPSCCYDCVSCPEGEISIKTDSENCQICPTDMWPTEKKDQCVPKVIEFLSYTNDIMTILFSVVSVSFAAITVLIFGILIHYHGTPIVKANNKNLSFLLLVSILLSYLSVFLFIGRPVNITCMLRHTSFGIFFSVAVSSLLAKTIMVGIAFKATKPGSCWRNWLGVKLSNSVVIILSSIQGIICVSWLAFSPPFQDLDMHSIPGKVIVQCNVGSVSAFYSVLGFMGLLAIVSFITAFYTRNLPDTFNESKFITFSMLVFLSVWIAMIPTYLSTKGKQMVIVEIFAILTSNTGLLGCIFFPKCYIILFRSKMNTKMILIGNVKK